MAGRSAAAANESRATVPLVMAQPQMQEQHRQEVAKLFRQRGKVTIGDSVAVGDRSTAAVRRPVRVEHPTADARPERAASAHSDANGFNSGNSRFNRQAHIGHPGQVSQPVDFESLGDAPLDLVRVVARLIPPEVWSRALFGASVRLQRRILPELPEPAGEQVRESLALSRPMRLREIDQAQQLVMDAWQVQISSSSLTNS